MVQQRRRRTRVQVLSCAVAFLPLTARASDWIGGSGNWSNAANWSAGVPTAGVDANISTTDGVARAINYDYAGPAVTIGTLTLATSAGIDTFTQTANALTSSALAIAPTGLSIFAQTGGTNTTSTLSIGGSAGGFGYYNLSGASAVLNVNGNSSVGSTSVGGDGLGTLSIQSGAASITGTLKVYDTGDPSTGTVARLQGGALTVGSLDTSGNPSRFQWIAGKFTISGAGGLELSPLDALGDTLTISGTKDFKLTNDLHVGSTARGAGTLIQSSATVTAAHVIVGFQTTTGSAASSYSLAGGTITTDLTVGSSNTVPAVVTQSGGTASLTNLTLAAGANSSGSYTISGGTLTASSALVVGNGGAATFAQSGGVLTVGGTAVAGAMSIGAVAGSSGAYSLGTGTTLTVNGAISVGGTSQVSGGVGVLNITGGTATATGAFKIYDTGTAAPGGSMVNLNGGKLSVGSFTNPNPSRFNWTAGTFAITAGALSLSPTGALGNSLSFDATRVLSATTLAVTSGAMLAVLGGSATGSSFTLTAGSSLSLSSGTAGGTNSTVDTSNISFTGGTFTASSSLTLGSTGTASLTQGGGSLTVGTLSIASTSTGVGTYALNTGTATVSTFNVGGRTAAGGTGIFHQSAGTLNVSGTLKLWNTGSAAPAGSAVVLTGGRLSVGTLDTNSNPARFQWSGGTFALTASTLIVGAGGQLGTSLTLSSSQSLDVSAMMNVTGSLTLNGGSVIGNGGILNTGALNGYGSVAGASTYALNNKATVNVTGGDLSLVGSNNLNALGATINLSTGRTLAASFFTNNGTVNLAGGTVNATITNNASGIVAGPGTVPGSITQFGILRANAGDLSITGGTNLTNNGLLDLTDDTARILGGQITNAATRTIQGHGKIENLISNDGIINATGGTLVLDGAVTANAGTLTAASGGTLVIAAGFLYGQTGTVSLNGGTVQSNVAVTNSGVISGSGNLVTPSLVNNSTVTLSGGTSSLGSLTGTGTTTVSGGTASAASIRASTLSITGGTVQVSQNGTAAATSRIPSLSITTGKLDLANNKLIVPNGTLGTLNGTTYTGITGWIQSARAGGTWTGNGITTSQSSAAAGLASLAIAKASDVGYTNKPFGGITVAANDVLVMYTYAGDANLDGKLNGDDYFALDSHYSQPGSASWTHGDFNYDGRLNGDDYFLLDSNVNRQSLGALPVATEVAASGLMPVPEPAASVMILLAAGVPLRRRRRN